MKIFNELVPEDKQHPKFKFLKKQLTGEKEILEDWVQGFEDRDGKIIKEFQTTFHSTFWEFYLFAIFKEAEFKINFDHNRPDFIITSPEDLYIEAVTSNIKQDGRKEEDRTLDDLLTMLTPPWEQNNFYQELDESIIRHSNAIHSKSSKYREYSKLPHVKKNVPYIIALGAYDQMNYGNQFYYPMHALLFGHYYDFARKGYVIKDSVLKSGSETKIPIGLFNTEKYKHISAIIFSSTVTLGKLTSLSLSQDKTPLKTNYVLNIGHQDELPHFLIRQVSPENPENLFDGLFIFHNPFAENKLSYNIFEKYPVTHIFKENDQIITKRSGPMLYSRFNSFKLPDEWMNRIILENHILFNRRELCFSQGLFSVLEIDYTYKEITLKHPEIPYPTIVDLNAQEIIECQKLNLKKGSKIEATIFSIPNEQGLTEQFRFLTNIGLVE